jgi:hypothetical protein
MVMGSAWKAVRTRQRVCGSIPHSSSINKYTTMHQAQQQAKIVWFVMRTGSSHEEAKKWLAEAKWRMEVAIRNRRFNQGARP